MKAMKQDEISKNVDEAYIMSLIQKVTIGKPGKASASVGPAAVAPAPALLVLRASSTSRVQATKIEPWSAPALQVSSVKYATRREDHCAMQPDKSMTESGIVQSPDEIQFNKINMNSYTYLRVYQHMIVLSIDVSEEETGVEPSQTKLDSHANTPAVGRNTYDISDTGPIANVDPFTPDYESMQIPIVNAAVRYNCPFIFVIGDALLL